MERAQSETVIDGPVPDHSRSRLGPRSSRAKILALTGALSIGCGSSKADESLARSEQAVVGTWSVLSDVEKQAQILDVLERFVPFAETFWRASDITKPNTGRYAAVGSGVTQPRGAGDIAFAYVTLLKAKPEQLTFGGVSRETMLDHTIQSIRHEAFTNTLAGAGYSWWGKGTWQAALEAYSWAFAAEQLWDRLDEETQNLVRTVVTGEANILITKAIASGEEGDTGAEDNGWNSPVPALAATMFPDDPNAAAWQTAAIRLALNASSISADATSEAVVDGRPIREWMASVNLHPDFTMENHGYFNPLYQQVTHVDINDAAIAYALAGQPLPQAFSFRTESIWENVLMRLATDEGDLAMTAGQDWISKDFQHLEYLGILATRMQRAEASVYESRALQIVAQRQATHPNGSMLGQAQVGYETMLIKRLAALWWTHRFFGPAPVPTAEQFAETRANGSGVKQFPYSDFIAASLGQTFVSMSWDAARPMALFIPSSDATPDDRIFSYYEPLNLLGAVSGATGPHHCDCAADRFSTAGTIGTRRFSMTAFPDGVAMLLDRGQGSTFTYSLESIAGITGPRRIWSASGDALGNLAGNWLNAADRFGMIVRGGAGINAATATGTNNRIVLTGSIATGSGNRGAVLLPLVQHDQTAALDAFVAQPEVPVDWSALSARAADGSTRLAIARWGGPSSASIQIQDERGAPVPDGDALITGNSAQFTARLGLPASSGQTMRFFLQGASTLRARQDGEQAALIRNPGSEARSVAVTYLASDGSTKALNRTIASGEEVRARLVDGDLTLAGPELEPLLLGREALADLVEELNDDDSGHCRAHCEHFKHLHHLCDAHIIRIAQVALTAIDQAISESRALDPDTERAARAVKLALLAVRDLEREGQHHGRPRALQDEIQSAAEAAERALEEALAQAYTISTWVQPVSAAQPGEPLVLQVTLLNRGEKQVRHGIVTLTGPDGWLSEGPVALFDELEPGQSASAKLEISVPASALPGDRAAIRADVSYFQGHMSRTKAADASVTVDPIVDLSPTFPQIPLAAGGVNQAGYHFVNLTNHVLDITLATAPPDGATASVDSVNISLPAAGSQDVTVALAGLARTAGSGVLTLTATTSAGAVVKADTQLYFSDDLALNTLGAPWPKGNATSNQASFPASLAFDGNASTFWVSEGSLAGQGPTPTQPQMLIVDFGLPANVGSVTMVPRVGYGPKAYSIDISSDGATWQTVANVASAPNATVTTVLSPVSTRYLRLQITGGWDRIQPPRNVQIIALNVRAAP